MPLTTLVSGCNAEPLNWGRVFGDSSSHFSLHTFHIHINSTEVDLDLQKTGLGWLAPLLKPTIKGQVEEILCDIIDSNLINVTNGVIEAIPGR